MQTLYFPSRPAAYALAISPNGPVQQVAVPAGISVYQLMNQLTKDLQPLAIKRHNIILNGIPKEMVIEAEETTLASVLRSLICNAINSMRNACIHIVALYQGGQVSFSCSNNG